MSSNERERLAKENGMTVEFVDWFFDTKKEGCGNAWFMMMAAMWEGWKAQEANLAALAAENAGLNNFIASSCYVLAGEEAAWHPAIDHAPETPATNQLNIAESQFLTDVMTAAGLLSCGKRDKQLAQRLADFCVSKRGGV